MSDVMCRICAGSHLNVSRATTRRSRSAFDAAAQPHDYLA